MSTHTFIERRRRERRQTPVLRQTVEETEQAAASTPLGGAPMTAPAEGTPGHYGAAYGEMDEHYQRWRSDRMRRLDDEYRLWRQGGSKNFPADFEAWRVAHRHDASDNAPPGDRFYERS